MRKSLEVTDVSVEELLNLLRAGEWLIPRFQRDFVWGVDDIQRLAYSVLETRPIGMVTLWEQADGSGLELEPVSIPDGGDVRGQTSPRYIAFESQRAARVYAVLDGRQRCTAIAMVFGGLRARNERYRFAGRFYLNVTETEPTRRVLFFPEAEVRRRQLDRDSSCIGQGLFPLTSNIDGEAIFAQWFRYTQSLKNPENYPSGTLPDERELERRNRILSSAYEGIQKTRLAVYVVPSTYSLSEICEIFETLNTTGTKVSTVDLIHSWLYAETGATGRPILLREWINELGERDGAIGWASTDERPELVAQIVTACFVALRERPDPRPVGRHRRTEIDSVKAADLLATPMLHWQNVMEHTQHLAQCIGDFQTVVAEGSFPWTNCPYPVSSAIYIALRWHLEFDKPATHPWEKHDLDALFKAFFWRNALCQRYDQGFLTQLGSDLHDLNNLLLRRTSFSSFSLWAQDAERELDAMFGRDGKVAPTESDLLKRLVDSRPAGAIGKALLLPLYARARRDLLDSSPLEYPRSSTMELHHIYPRGWCRDNLSEAQLDAMSLQVGLRLSPDSVANLMPLSRQSNNVWKSRLPGAVLEDRGITYASVSIALEEAFINESAFADLQTGARGISSFWMNRGKRMAAFLLSKMRVSQ